jgi:hypothetical protein
MITEQTFEQNNLNKNPLYLGHAVEALQSRAVFQIARIRVGF